MNDLLGWVGNKRNNYENVVANPYKDFVWLTLPPQRTAEHLLQGITKGPESREELFARILHGAKKGDWDVQTTINPRDYGVRP